MSRGESDWSYLRRPLAGVGPNHGGHAVEPSAGGAGGDDGAVPLVEVRDGVRGPWSVFASVSTAAEVRVCFLPLGVDRTRGETIAEGQLWRRTRRQVSIVEATLIV